MVRIALITYSSIEKEFQENTLPKVFKAFMDMGYTVEHIALKTLSFQNTSKEVSIFSNGKQIKPFDILLPFYKKTDRWAHIILKMLKAPNGIIVTHPQLSLNKSEMVYKFAKHHIPHPQTHVFFSLENALNYWEKSSHKALILKPLFGLRGQNVFLAKDKQKYKKAVNILFKKNASCLVQEAILPLGKDIRVLVVNGQILGAYERIAPKGSFLSNLSQGGTAQEVTLTKEEKESALRAATAFDLFLCGVDLMRKEDGSHVILEVNANPGIKGFSIFKEDMATKIAKACLTTLKKEQH